MRIIWAGITGIIGILMISITWIALNPTQQEIFSQFNSTWFGQLSGTPQTVFSNIQTIAKYALGFSLIIGIGAILLWMFLSSHERETVYGRYG